MTRPTSLGVLVPCRNEVAVVARKVANLARASWPLGAAHRLVIVDDGSDDGTAEAARAALALHAQALEAAGVSAEVVANDVRPGKPGAIAAGLARIAEVDLVVLTDADVVLEPAAPCALALAFERDARLAMACGAQRFVRDLADDGSAAAADGGEPVPAAGGFDRWTARVRRIERPRRGHQTNARPARRQVGEGGNAWSRRAAATRGCAHHHGQGCGSGEVAEGVTYTETSRRCVATAA
jgi:hypothetical protein